MTKTTLKKMPLSSLKAAPYNPRHISEQALGGLKESISRFGLVQPIVWNKRTGRVVSGHQRIAALKQIGLKTADVIIVDWPELKEKEANIALNNRAIEGDFTVDINVLLNEIEAQDKEAFDALLFDEIEIPTESVNTDDIDEGDIVDPPEQTEIKMGDLFDLDGHRLLCGDCSNPDDVNRVLGGGRATCVFTDPPYGVSIGAKNRFLNSVQKSGRCLENIKSDDLKPESLRETLLPVFQVIKDLVMADDATLLTCSPQVGDLGLVMLQMLIDAGLPTRHVLIWKKNQPTFSMGRLDYDYAHEPILLTWGKKHKRIMAGDYKTSVWEVSRERKCDAHPTMKPVDLYVNAYLNHSERGDIVFDGFAGSGTAFIAAEQVGRRCAGVEISPNYCDAIIRRWEGLTGKKSNKIS